MITYNAPVGTMIARKRRTIRQLEVLIWLIKTLTRLQIVKKKVASETNIKIKQRIKNIEKEIGDIYNQGK